MTNKMPKVTKIVLKEIVDTDPDLSYLEPGALPDYEPENAERLASYNRGEWYTIGIKAYATIEIPIDEKTSSIQTIESGGLWGIESDSRSDYKTTIGKEEVDEVKHLLRTLQIDGINEADVINL